MRKLIFNLAIVANVLLAVSFFGGPERIARAAQQLTVVDWSLVATNATSTVLTEWQQGVGFNFRSTSGFTTDNTGQLYGLGYADSYPQTRTPVGYSNGVTFGRGSGLENQSNRDSGIDPRFGGSMRIGNGGGIERVWQVDLPAGGDYEIRVAAGDTAVASDCTRFQVRDTNNTTVLLECDAGTTQAADTYWDASCVNRTEANWPSQNVAETVTFTGGSPTKLNFHLGGGSCGTQTSQVAHLHIKQL